MGNIRYRDELCPDRGELLRRFLNRRDQLLLVVDGGLPGELDAVQRGITYLRGRASTDTNRLGRRGNLSTSGSLDHAARCDTMRHSEDEVRR